MGASVLCDHFVGRASELELLRERFRLAAAAQGSMVLLRGEAGIGKTRFVAEFRRWVAQERAAVLTGECLEYARAPLAPFVDALERIADLDPDAAELYERLTGVLDAEKREEATAKRRQFIAIFSVLRRFAQRAPCVVVVEDLHWADHATLELLQFLAPRVVESRLLIVATYRSDELHRRHPVTAPLARILRSESVLDVTLEPFSPAEMNAFVRATLHGRDLDFRVVATIKALAEGNAFFAEELLRNALDKAVVPDGELPPSIRDVVLARLNLLAEEDQRILMQAAVLGTEFEPGLLAAIAGCPLDAVRGVLRRARDLQLLREHAGDVVTYGFRHALTREALCGELLAEEARTLHAAVAAELEARGSNRVSELAYHFWAARDAAKAVAYNVAAGNAAAGICAFSDAAVLYERAIEFVAGPGPERALIREKSAEALFNAGAGKAAARQCERSLADYELCGDREAAANICARMAYQSFWSCDGEGCLRWCTKAAEMVRAAPRTPRSEEILGYVARILGILGDLRRSLEYLEACSVDPVTADAAILVLQARGNASAMSGDAGSAIEMLRRAAAIAAGNIDSIVVARGNLALVSMEFGQDAIAQAAADEALRFAREHRLPARELYVLGVRAETHLRAGQLLRALSDVNEALPLLDVVDFPGFMYAKLTSASLRLGLRMRKPELICNFDAERMLQASFQSKGAEFIAEMAAAFAEKLVDEGRFGEAAALLHRAVPAVGDGISRAPILVLTAAYGDLADAGIARNSLDSWARPDNVVGRAHLALFDAHVAHRKGDRTASVSTASQAVDLFSSLCRPYELAQTLELKGEVSEARSIYERIGDVRDAERLRAQVVGVNRRGRMRDELTLREREISTLVAGGKSNRAIGEELVISERTVEKHVESILAKTGASSRTELAARLSRVPDAIGTGG